MTERAKRAAAELMRRGWQVDIEDDGTQLDKQCTRCGQQIPGDARFCQHCGERVSQVVAASSLADIEAAIAAALKGAKA